MQQSKALYSFNFFTCIVQNQKMLEITSNQNQFRFVRIDNNWYKFWPSNGWQSHHRLTKIGLQYFGPFPAKRRFEIETFWYFLVRTLLKMPQAQKSNGLNPLESCWVLLESRNVRLARSSKLSLRHFRDNIQHLFWPHGWWTRAGNDHRLLRVMRGTIALQ